MNKKQKQNKMRGKMTWNQNHGLSDTNWGQRTSSSPNRDSSCKWKWQSSQAGAGEE